MKENPYIKKKKKKEHSDKDKRCYPFLRREVLQADYTPLPHTISLEDVLKGEVNTAEDLMNFFGILCWS